MSEKIKAKAVMLDAEVSAAETGAPPIAEVVPGSPEAIALAESMEPPIDYLAEARGVINVTVAMVIPVIPPLADVYTPEAKEELAQATAPLLERYGITAGGIFNSPWLRFLSVAIPLGLKTVEAVKTWKAQKETQTREAERPSSPTTPTSPEPLVSKSE